MFAVFAAEGRTGPATAEALLRDGQRVRVLVKDAAQAEPWTRRHAEAVVVDPLAPATWTAALSGVAGAFLALPAPPEPLDFLSASAALADQLAQAARAAKLPHLVLRSAAGAQHPAGTGPVVALHRAEKALGSAVPTLTALRAAWRLERWAAGFLPALETGELPFCGPIHLHFPQVGAHDVGVAAARALVAGGKGPRVLELQGKDAWSPEEVAAVVHALLEAPVKAVSVPPEQWVASLRAGGLSEARAALEAERYQALSRGLLTFTHAPQALRGGTSLYDALKPLA